MTQSFTILKLFFWSQGSLFWWSDVTRHRLTDANRTRTYLPRVRDKRAALTLCGGSQMAATLVVAINLQLSTFTRAPLARIPPDAGKSSLNDVNALSNAIVAALAGHKFHLNVWHDPQGHTFHVGYGSPCILTHEAFFAPPSRVGRFRSGRINMCGINNKYSPISSSTRYWLNSEEMLGQCQRRWVTPRQRLL